MVSDKPLVSILTTSYNYGRYIGQTIQSALDQTYHNWELIISDDASTDNSLEVIRAFDDPRITLITSDKNIGGPANRAKAYALCKGKYLNTLNSDDYITPDKLEKQVSYLEEYPEVDVLGTFVTEIDGTGQSTGDRDQHEAWFNTDIDLNDPNAWLWQNHLCHSSVLIRKAVHDRIGPFTKELSYAGDYEFWVRCLVGGATFHVLPEQLTCYRSHGENITHKDSARALMEQAYIFCAYLKPYLLVHRRDLIPQSIVTFLMNHEPYQAAGITLKANLLKNFLSDEATPQDFNLFVADIQNPPSLEAVMLAEICGSLLQTLQDSNKVYRHHQTWINQLEQDKTWLETQRRTWENVAAEWERLAAEQQQLAAQQQRLAEERQGLIEKQQTQIEHLETTLNNIYQTRVWKLARKYWAFKEKILSRLYRYRNLGKKLVGG